MSAALRLFQARTPTGLTEPMTGPEVIEWAVYHNMQFRLEPSQVFNEFTVVACDLAPLSEDEIQAFRQGCRERPVVMSTPDGVQHALPTARTVYELASPVSLEEIQHDSKP